MNKFTYKHSAYNIEYTGSYNYSDLLVTVPLSLNTAIPWQPTSGCKPQLTDWAMLYLLISIVQVFGVLSLLIG